MMEQITHAELVRALCKSGEQMAAEMTPEKAHLWHMVTCIAGEAGELIDTVKRHVIYGKNLDIGNIVEELGDLEFYLEGLRQGIDLPRELTLKHNIAKLSVRYAGLKYTDEAAVARADKEPNLTQVLDNYTDRVRKYPMPEERK
jgi:NTP pyrophosphatase (non-canonical NTP hydrolase)